MKKIINSKYFKWFRKNYLNRIYSDIILNKAKYCCVVYSWHSFFICWKDLKEVKDNMNSVFLRKEIRDNISFQNCVNSWFWHKTERINFLKECLNKLN